MKNLAIFVVLMVSVFFVSCQKDNFFENEDQKSMIFTDTPPAELTFGIKNPSIVYISSQEINEAEFWDSFLSDRYFDEEQGKIVIAPCSHQVYKIRGRVYFGFYKGNMYMSNSFGEYSIDSGTLQKLYKAADEKRYALCTKEVEVFYQSGLGLRIIDPK